MKLLDIRTTVSKLLTKKFPKKGMCPLNNNFSFFELNGSRETGFLYLNMLLFKDLETTKLPLKSDKSCQKLHLRNRGAFHATLNLSRRQKQLCFDFCKSQK